MKANVDDVALHMKLIWKIIVNSSNLWVEMVKKKYVISYPFLIIFPLIIVLDKANKINESKKFIQKRYLKASWERE